MKKYTQLAFGLLLCGQTMAQKNRIYADAGLSLAYLNPGFSTTYNYNIFKHFGVGAGTQAYVFRPTATNARQFTPAVFMDLRFLIRPEKISQYFIFLDGGVNFYRHNDEVSQTGKYAYKTEQDNGIYVGLGTGYFLRLIHRGWGPYATIKLINNFYQQREIDLTTNDERTISSSGGTVVVSLGFRFLNDTRSNDP